MGNKLERRYCVLLPAYREEGRIGDVVKGILPYCASVLVIDDGSPDEGAAEAEQAGATVVRHETNCGKGVALNTGFRYAREHGYECVLTMDADGQHAATDIPGFLDKYEQDGTAVIIGNRMASPDGMPFVRRMTNRFMSWLLSREMGQRVPDTQSGYRLYKCSVIPDMQGAAGRFAAESEILLRFADAGVRMGAVPIQVIYGDEKSKIHPVKDTIRFFGMLRRHRRERRAHVD